MYSVQQNLDPYHIGNVRKEEKTRTLPLKAYCHRGKVFLTFFPLWYN